VATFKQLTALQPTNPINHVRLAEALAGNKDIAGSKASLRKALEIKPDLAIAKRALVSLSLQEKRPEEGLALIKDMQKADGKDASAFALEGDVHMSQRNSEAAVTAYRTAMQLSKTTENFVRLHSALRAGGKGADADRLAAEWLKDRPKDAALRYYLGDVAMAGGNLATAESQYRSVLEVQPRNALAMNNVAWLLVKQKKPGAVEMAQKANELMPGKPPLMDTLATALAAENQLPKAIETQKAAIARSPNDPSLKLNLARFLIQSGDKAYARAELEDIAKLGDKFSGQAEVAELLKKL
jgi:cellulose synthase operon protein C